MDLMITHLKSLIAGVTALGAISTAAITAAEAKADGTPRPLAVTSVRAISTPSL
jgi:hypothetical protein